MNGTRRRSGVDRLAVPAVLIVLIGCAAALLGRIYDGPVATWLVAGAGGSAVVVGTVARRLPNWQVAPLSVMSMAGYLLAAGWWTARRSELPGPVSVLLAEAAVNGVPRLLTAMIPMEPVPDTVLVPVVASWLAGFTATELAVRGRRMLLGCLPPVLLFGAAVFVVGPNAEPAHWPAVGFIAATALGLALTAEARAGGTATPQAGVASASGGSRPTPTRVGALRLRSAALSAAGAGAVLLVVALTAPVLVARIATTGVDPRRYVTPPQVDSLDENPLSRISGWALNPDQPLFDVQVTAVAGGSDEAPVGPAAQAGPARLRLAVLHDYDGVTWRVGGTYRNAGRVLPESPSDGITLAHAESRPVRQRITVAQLTGRLLPAIPTPSRVDGVRVAYDATSGTLLHPEGLTAGVSYQVESVPPRPALNALTTADVPAGESVARVLRVADGVPADISRLARQLAEDNGAPYQRALAAEQFLAEHYRLVADAPSGHAYPNLGFFLLGPRDAGGQRGTSEQFATAYALLGRLMGLPTRVVVGFVGPPGGGMVQGVHAVAWPEVLFAGVGWVPFDPLPRPDSTPRPVEEDFRPAPVESTPPVEPTSLPEVDAAPTPPSAAAGGSPPARGDGWLISTAGGAIVAVLAGGIVAVLVLRRRQRRHRLAVGAPADRIAGAWLEVVDALRLAGHPAGAHLSASEVTRHSGSLPGGPLPSLAPLAEVVNLATFAPRQADQGQATRAGTYATEYVAALRSRRPWWRRILWSLHPGPLRWRRRGSPTYRRGHH
ncbi:DUF3488 and transglutaminase-like domain-containing protein [Solwaraspora sp. WMMA2056]|uniref:transglutaminase family protein n=1 Tax=Solwaraspora sp. WMMA2056 TaxID=3015161 RepID=UPI00259BB962|nr:DUF3488 and transglutaminase-like domain-containing protein [Solwaraspora sp. WMMA2056]WJK38498.1 DUF3488 and transglutaminase-like domain-containing protein [Solwaraspora sp. WMMA2056]